MARKTRETTSVSTLVNLATECMQIAHSAGRRDLLREILPLLKEAHSIAARYEDCRAAINVWHARLARPISILEIEASIAAIEEAEEEIEA